MERETPTAWAIRQQTGSNTAKLVLLVLAVLSADGVVTRGIPELAELAEVNRSTVSRAIGHLTRRGLITVTRVPLGRGGLGVNQYRLVRDDAPAVDEDPVASGVVAPERGAMPPAEVDQRLVDELSRAGFPTPATEH